MVSLHFNGKIVTEKWGRVGVQTYSNNKRRKEVTPHPDTHVLHQVLSTYVNRTIKDSKIRSKLNFRHNSPYPIQQRNDHGKGDNVSLALNVDQVEISY